MTFLLSEEQDSRTMSAKCQDGLRQNRLPSFGDTELILVTISKLLSKIFQSLENRTKGICILFFLFPESTTSHEYLPNLLYS